MTGERRPAYPLRLADRLQQLLPNAERVEIAGASHLMHEENATAVVEVILGFFARHTSQPSSESRRWESTLGAVAYGSDGNDAM
jgi:hypothetical protein